MLGVEEANKTLANIAFGLQKQYHVTDKPGHIFPRLDSETEISAIRDMMNHKALKVVKEPANKQEITIDMFDQIETKVGLVISAEYHKNAKKLLVLQINTGEKVRQVVSGIAEYYQPVALIGKKVLVITNLQPVKLRGEMSEGMILCGETKNHELYIIEADEALFPGDNVR